MIKIEETEVYGFRPAFRGMRNAKNSWERADSTFENGQIISLGENDKRLTTSLSVGGGPHAKYRRMIKVWCDITAPLYWWKEFDTYKVGTVANSCSTMHKLHSRPLTIEDFSHEKLYSDELECLKELIEHINGARELLVSENGCKDDWWQMIQLLPSSYNQKRTVELNYEVLSEIYKWRNSHKLDEWRMFCKWVEFLPYFAPIIAPCMTGADLESVIKYDETDMAK